MSPAPASSDNTRGILFMLATCTCFIFNDTFVKLASEDMPIPQVIVIRSLIGLPLAILVCARAGVFRRLSALRDRLLWVRTAGELGGSALYLSALARLDIAVSTSITQIVPLAVTGAAAILFGEPVGWRRWSAIALGFLAVLIIVRPGLASFNIWSVAALLTVATVVVRDLASRRMGADVDPRLSALLAIAALIPLGLVMSLFEPWRAVTPRALAYCLAAAVLLNIAYVLTISAVRIGDMSVVAPFRYSVLLWAIVLQILIFGVWPDTPTLLGSAILVATGVYTVYRERKVKGRGADLTAGLAGNRPPNV